MLSRFHTVHCVAARFCLPAVALLARTENLRFGLWLRRDFIGGGNGAAGFIEEEFCAGPCHSPTALPRRAQWRGGGRRQRGGGRGRQAASWRDRARIELVAAPSYSASAMLENDLALTSTPNQPRGVLAVLRLFRSA
jgi:hypothetical protein